MTSIPLPGTPPAHARIRKSPIQWIIRAIAAAVLATGGILLLTHEIVSRALETRLAAMLLSLLGGNDAIATTVREMPAAAFRVGDAGYVLRLTPECSVALFLGPLLLFGAALSLLPRFGLVRVVSAVVLSGVVLAAFNQARLMLLAYALSHYGLEGFHWAHSLAGSFIMLAGLAISVWILFSIVGTQPFARRRRRSSGVG